MRISGANLLLVSQQAAPAATPAPGFASALKQASGFTPRDLSAPEPAAKAEPQTAPSGPARPGMRIDLKV